MRYRFAVLEEVLRTRASPGRVTTSISTSSWSRSMSDPLPTVTRLFGRGITAAGPDADGEQILLPPLLAVIWQPSGTPPVSILIHPRQTAGSSNNTNTNIGPRPRSFLVFSRGLSSRICWYLGGTSYNYQDEQPQGQMRVTTMRTMTTSAATATTIYGGGGSTSG